MIGIRSGRRLRATSALGLALLIVPAFTGVANGAGQADVAQVRQATLKYRDVNAAIADGYVEFYKCTEQPGVGTMGQHYVKLPLVGDPAIGTGRFRIVCSREGAGEGIEEIEAVGVPVEVDAPQSGLPG